jgi:hypothetical protein
MDAKSRVDRWLSGPEPKLELIGGRLIVGDSLDGSRWLLFEILDGWGPAVALPMAPRALWLQALARGFAALGPPAAGEPSPLEEE